MKASVWNSVEDELSHPLGDILEEWSGVLENSVLLNVSQISRFFVGEVCDFFPATANYVSWVLHFSLSLVRAQGLCEAHKLECSFFTVRAVRSEWGLGWKNPSQKARHGQCATVETPSPLDAQDVILLKQRYPCTD